MKIKIEQPFKRLLSSVEKIVANTAEILPTLMLFLVLAFITILSYETVDLFYKVISFSSTHQSEAVRNSTALRSDSDKATRNSLQDYDIITGRNLFLSTLKPLQLEGGLFSSSQEVTAFDLKGTVAGGTSFGFIVIEERGKNKQRLYRLGDMIGSAKLIKITRNTAVIKSGEEETTLKIKETMEGSLLPNSPVAGRSRATPETFTSKQRAVNENLSDLKSMMNQAVVRPFLDKGVQAGYIISNIAPNSLYEKVGLQNGDIIIDINNNRMQSADSLLQLINTIQSGSSINLNIKRNGKIESISY